MTTATLAPPPRNIPAVVWWRISFGTMNGQVNWWCLAVFTWIAAALDLSGVPQKFPPWLFGICVIMGTTPGLVLSAIRARRKLALLRHGVSTQGTLIFGLEARAPQRCRLPLQNSRTR